MTIQLYVRLGFAIRHFASDVWDTTLLQALTELSPFSGRCGTVYKLSVDKL